MNIDDMIIVSIDDHVIEPPDMFERHVPARYADQAPRHRQQDEGIERWVFQGDSRGSMGLNAVVSLAQGGVGHGPHHLRRDAPGAYDVHERIRDMNRNGVLASMCFPTFAGFSAPHVPGGQGQGPGPRHAEGLQRLAHRRVVRVVPRPVHPAGDRAGRGTWTRWSTEVHRVAAKGCRAITMPELPHIQGLPSYYSDYWDPFFGPCATRTRRCACTSARASPPSTRRPTRRSTTS